MEDTADSLSNMAYCWSCDDWHRKDTPGGQHPEGIKLLRRQFLDNQKETKRNSKRKGRR